MTLVSISSMAPAQGAIEQVALQKIYDMPVVVVAMHEGCDCRCVMCDIWKIREPQQISIAHLEQQLESFERLGVRWVALTGGEPQRHQHFGRFTQALRARGIRITMLTAGMTLDEHAAEVVASVDDVIVSLDGPPDIHDRIRRVPNAFRCLESGIQRLKKIRAGTSIGARCTVQRANHDVLCRTVNTAKALGVDSISFLAADLTSPAFNRSVPWTGSRQSAVALDSSQVIRLEEEIETIIEVYGSGGFVVESGPKLRRIVRHFRAHLGEATAVAPRCNAPWVSAVIEANGVVRPCFFHAPIGNIRTKPLADVINSPEALQFRSELEVRTNPTCQRCVCSLYIPPTNSEEKPITTVQVKSSLARSPHVITSTASGD